MKVIKLLYMNDEKKDVIVRVLDLRYDPTTATGDMFVTLRSCEQREFEVHMPDNSILYLKKWSSMVMLSYHEQSALQQDALPEELPQDPLDKLKGSSPV